MKLTPYQKNLLRAQIFLIYMPICYTNLDLTEGREYKHARQRETFRIIWSGDASIYEHNEKINASRMEREERKNNEINRTKN